MPIFGEGLREVERALGQVDRGAVVVLVVVRYFQYPRHHSPVELIPLIQVAAVEVVK